MALEPFAFGVRKAHRGDLVGERVHPHVHDVLSIAGYADAPIEGVTRYRQIPQPAFNETHHLVQALARQYELRISGIEFEEILLVDRELKEIALLSTHLTGAPVLAAIRAPCPLTCVSSAA